MGIRRSQWAFEGSPQTLASVGLLGAGHAAPTLLLVLLFHCYCLDSRALLFCDTLLPWTPGHPDRGGGWVPPFLCPCCSPGLPCPPPPLTPGWSPGPLRFHHMSGEVTLATAGMSLGGSRAPLPPVIRLLASVSESHLEASFYPFYLQGEIDPPQAVAAGSRQMAAPQRHPEGQLLPVLCSCGLLSVVPHRGYMCVGGVGWGLITGPDCLGSRPSSATC